MLSRMETDLEVLVAKDQVHQTGLVLESVQVQDLVSEAVRIDPDLVDPPTRGQMLSDLEDRQITETMTILYLMNQTTLASQKGLVWQE